MYTASTQFRVRYAETDQMGYVYYGNYAMYYEVGRVEALRQLGFVYRELEEQGVMMPVIESNFRYLKPARYDELLTVEVTIPKMPTAKIIFKYKVMNEAGELINSGETTLVFIEIASGKPKRIPGILRELFEPFYQ